MIRGSVTVRRESGAQAQRSAADGGGHEVIQTADAEAEESAAEKEAAAASLAKTTGDDADGEFLKFCACDKRAGEESKQRERKEGGRT